jgi:hypothetical protein
MPTTLQDGEVRRVRRDLGGLLGDREGAEDPAVAERLGAGFLAMGQVSGAGPDLVKAALASLEEAGNAHAAGVLAAMAVLARGPLAEQAGAVLGRLHEAGVHSPVEDAVGTLRVEEARRLDLGGGEVLMAMLSRACSRQVQVAVVMIEHDETNGAAVGGDLSPPGKRRVFGKFLREIEGATGTQGSPLPPGALAETLRGAFSCSAEAGLAVPFDLGVAAPILARALTGDPGAFAAVAVDGGHELSLDPEDDDEFESASEELAEHLFEVCEGDPVVERSGPFVAGTMLDYKWRYGDRQLGCWTTEDLDDYLLDYFPRKVSADHELVADTPACVVAFLTMLDDHDALQGPSLQVLGAHVEAMNARFRRAAEDRRRWGPAKSAMMAMLAEGVDPEDPGAVQDWIDAVNARPDLLVSEARQLTGNGPRPHYGPGHGRQTPSAARAKQQRKTARAARRRNRR